MHVNYEQRVRSVRADDDVKIFNVHVRFKSIGDETIGDSYRRRRTSSVEIAKSTLFYLMRSRRTHTEPDFIDVVIRAEFQMEYRLRFKRFGWKHWLIGGNNQLLNFFRKETPVGHIRKIKKEYVAIFAPHVSMVTFDVNNVEVARCHDNITISVLYNTKTVTEIRFSSKGNAIYTIGSIVNIPSFALIDNARSMQDRIRFKIKL